MVKFLEENRGSKLPDIGWSNDFLHLIPKAKATKPETSGTTTD